MMPKITYQYPSGEREEVNVSDHDTVMRAAILHGVTGIVGECGGQAMCATCHVYVLDSSDSLPQLGPDEDDMLDCTAAERKPSSRLGCQLDTAVVGDIVVELPGDQL